MSQYLIRLSTASDLDYILPTWGYGVWRSLGGSVDLSRAAFVALFKDVQLRLMRKSVTYVACLPDAPDVLIGYLIIQQGDPTQAHWGQVKRPFRNVGVMRDIMSSAGISKDERLAYAFNARGFRYPEKWIHVPHWLSEVV